MLTIFLRTVIIYTVLIISMRLMGKRQIGELEVSDLVTTLMVSEIAVTPIENTDLPVLYAVIPIITLLSIEVISSVALIKIPALKSILSARPAILIRAGKIDQKELQKNRISLEELMCELRGANCTNPTQVEYAILEKNGKLTVIPKARFSPPTADMFDMEPQESGMLHLLVIDGKICPNNLEKSGKSRAWLDKKLKELKKPMESIYLLGVDDSDQLLYIRKDSK